MRPVLVDSAVALHADGNPDALRDPCRRILAAAGAGQLEAHASVEFVQEYVHVNHRRGNSMEKTRKRVELLRRTLRLHPFAPEMIPSVLDLLRDHPVLHTRDAIHAATAIDLGLDTIVSPDKHFDGLGSLERLDPLDRDVMDAVVGGV